MKANLKGLFSEILAGISQGTWNNKLIYFKHFTHYDIGLFSQEEEKIYEFARKQGLSSEQECIDRLIKEGIWSQSQENDLRQQKEFLENRLNTKKNLIIQEQINRVNKEIEETQIKINSILQARNQYVGFTIEHWTTKKMNEFHMSRATYLDYELKELLFEKENEDLEDSQVEELMLVYNNSLDKLNKNIKRLAISDFFQNIFHLAPESIYEFYGKPVTNLTISQQDLYVYARFFSNILQSDNKPSKELLDDPEKLIEQYQKNTNLKNAIGEGKGDLNGASVIGATKEELKQAGVEGKFVNFRAKLKPGQTELDSISLANIFNS